MPSDVSLGRQLRLLSRAFRRFFSARMLQSNLPRTCAPALSELYFHPGLSQDQLAYALAIDKTMAAKLCKELEAEHLIRREINPADRRGYRLFLEPAGMDAMPAILECYRAWNAHLVRDLTVSERATLDRLLEKLAQAAQKPP